MPAEGGPAVQLTRHGGRWPRESWDGRFVYFAKGDRESAIWRVPVDGGEETEVLAGPLPSAVWALGHGGIYFWEIQRLPRGQHAAIQYLDLESGEVSEVFRKDGPAGHGWLAVSPGEEWILYSETPAPTSELMLVENFR
jgi:hypothetical protein